MAQEDVNMLAVLLSLFLEILACVLTSVIFSPYNASSHMRSLTLYSISYPLLQTIL
jgi:hypothetical protein